MCRLDSVQVSEAPTLYLWAYASVILSVYLIRPTTDGDDAPFFIIVSSSCLRISLGEKKKKTSVSVMCMPAGCLIVDGAGLWQPKVTDWRILHVQFYPISGFPDDLKTQYQ